MRNELVYIEQIEKYLSGKFSAEEKAAFEKRIESDASLRQDVELQQQIVERIQLQAFKGEMVNFHKNFAQVTTTSSFIKKGFWLNAFLGLVITGSTAATVYYFVSQKNDAPISTITTPAHETIAENTAAPASLNQPATNAPGTIAVTNPTPHNTRKNISGVPFISTPPRSIPAPNAEESPCKNFELDFFVNEIDAQTGGSFETQDSKSVFYFPQNIIVDKKGKTVYGKVEIHYREYRNAAQMAFSKIPMVYTENGKEFFFNSAGMFEVRAYQNGEELFIKPGASFKVHYNVTQKPDSCFFFALNDKTQEWTKKNPINFKRVVSKTGGQLFFKITNAATGQIIPGVKITCRSTTSQFVPYADMKNDSGYRVASVGEGTHSFEISCAGYNNVQINNVKIYAGKKSIAEATMVPIGFKGKKDEKKSFIQRTVTAIAHMFKSKNGKEKIKEDDELYHAEVRVKDTVGCNEVLPGKKAEIFNDVFSKEEVVWSDNGDRTSNTMMAEGINAGHTYPNMVKGLQCESFGVYNCDQIYKLQDRIYVQAEYKDEQGNKIEAQHVLSMIDLKYNGAFSFSPENFTCSAGGKNVLLLFTQDKKLYALSEAAYSKMFIEKPGKYTFVMKDITAEVKDENDLKKFLGLK